MVRVSDLRPGNWFIDKRDGNLCTVHTVTPTLDVERFNNNIYRGNIYQLEPIKLKTKLVSLCGFQFGHGNTYERTLLSGKKIFLAFDNLTATVWNEDGEAIAVRFVHELQNAHYDLTGESLSINLYGSESS